MVTTANIDNDNQDKDKDNVNVNDLYRCTHFTLTTRKINDKLTELVCINCDQVVATWEDIPRTERDRLELDELLRWKEIERKNKPMYYYHDDVIKEWT